VRTRGDKTYYGFTAKVNAKEMADVISGQYFYTNGSSAVKDYSVKQYADIALVTDTVNAKLKSLSRALLDYGMYAQEYFEYNTSNLACNPKDVSPDVFSVTADTLEAFKANSVQGTPLVPLSNVSLLLKTETSLRLIFTPDASVSEMTVTYNGNPLSVTTKDSYKYVEILNIAAQYLDDTYTVTVYDGTETADVTYGPMAYCYNVLKNSTNNDLKNVARALYLYNRAANDYFN